MMDRPLGRPLEAPLSDGGHLSYTVRGEGTPLLLLRPLGGSLVSWDRFADALARHARVIAFDARGTGRSSAAPLATSTRTMARDALALVDHLRAHAADPGSLERVDVYGISLGGMVATWLAIEAPARVSRVVLASTLPRGLSVDLGSAGRGFSLARCLLRRPADAEACVARRILSGRFVDEHPAEVHRIEALARKHPASRRGLMTLLLAAAAHDARASLHRIIAPTLILVGERDPLLTLSSQRALLARIAGAEVDVIPDAGHDVSVEQPLATAARVLRFLRPRS